jgi:hypothetical protein
MPTFAYSGDKGTAELLSTNQNYNIYNCTGDPDSSTNNPMNGSNPAIVRVNKPQPDYPFQINGSQQSRVEIFGLKVIGQLSLTTPWGPPSTSGTLYNNYNSAAIIVKGVEAYIHDCEIGMEGDSGSVFDGIRLPDLGGVDHIIDRVHIRRSRDDAVETDVVPSGTLTVRDCLFENLFAGISATHGQFNRTIYVENLLMHVRPYPYESPTNIQNGPMWKVDGNASNLSDAPRWVVNNSVFAWTAPMDAQWNGRTAAAFGRWSGSNNYICVLGGNLVGSFPALPPGTTLLQGQAAIDYWNTRRAQQIAMLYGTTTTAAYVTRNVVSSSPSGLITFDRRLAYPATTFTARSTGPSGLTDDETFTAAVVSSSSDLPTGDEGIAANYTNDVGISAHPSVIFHDTFESYATSSDLFTPYGSVYQLDLMDFVSDPAVPGVGTKALRIEFEHPRYNNADLAITGVEVIHVRVNMKMSAGFTWLLNGFNQASAAHAGITISSSYDGAGVFPTGTNHFLVVTDPTKFRDEAQPGYIHNYVYHMNQGSGFGDHLYSDGQKVPSGSGWTPGVDFAPIAPTQPPLDEWFTLEIRGEANTPGQANGRVTTWLNGAIISDLTGLRFRSTTALKWDLVQIGVGQGGGLSGSLPAQYVYFDNLVVATEYIGPVFQP